MDGSDFFPFRLQGLSLNLPAHISFSQAAKQCLSGKVGGAAHEERTGGDLFSLAAAGCAGSRGGGKYQSWASLSGCDLSHAQPVFSATVSGISGYKMRLSNKVN